MTRALLLAAAALCAAPAFAESPDIGAEQEVAIPFFSSDQLLDWRADGDRGVYIRSNDGRWYYARVDGPCGRLADAQAIGFETARMDQLDRHGAIRVQGWRCPIESLTVSGAPPIDFGSALKRFKGALPDRR